jgi:heavy metal sensor kinase
VTLRQRLFLWYGGVLFATAVVLVLSVYLTVAHKVRGEFHQFLTDEYLEAVAITNEHIEDQRALRLAMETEMKGARFFRSVYRLYDLDKDEELLALSIEQEWIRKLPPFHIPEKEQELATVLLRSEGMDREAADEIHFLAGWPDKENRPNLLLNVGLCYDRVWLRLRSLRQNLFVALLVTMLLAGIGGHVLSSRGLKPIHQIATSLGSVSAHDLSYRLPEPEAQDEIGRIVESVNSMLKRLEDAFEQLRAFTADAAHELRSPLAAAKCRLDVALERQRTAEEYEDAIQDALDRLAGLGTLVDSLLLLAELDAKHGGQEHQRVKLCALLADIAEFFEVAAEQKGTRLTVMCPEGCTVTGNADLLRRLFSNLIENAIRHTPPGGTVGVETSCAEKGCIITVSDTGDGMSTEELGKIFRRFYRADSARTWRQGGAGLGLSICQKIVEVHGGTIDVESEEGKGTRFRVHLPGCQEDVRTASS